MRRLVAVLGTLALLVVTAIELDRAFPPDLSRLAAAGSVVRDASGQVLTLRPAPGGVWQFHADVNAVPTFLLDLLVNAEDRHFYRHPGVNPLAIARALAQDVAAGHVVSGGSTLTMQVARLLEPRPRTIVAKLLESVRALQLSVRFDKRAVLGMWLALAPFGGNLVGREAASRAYFGKPSATLDAAEAALLVALPRRPGAIRPDRHPGRALALRNRILQQAARDGLLGPSELQRSLAEPVPSRRVPMPDTGRLLFARERGDLDTTLDGPLQHALDGTARAELLRVPPQVSLAVMIADLRARTVIAAWPGDAGNAARAGWMDLTRAVRSPGSALKPFLYALAFEDGLAAPDTILADGPQRFADYSPEDFSRRFAGRVTAAEALQRSLNLPAVLLLARYGAQRFTTALHDAGLVLPSGAAGSLPVVLGGAGMKLRDMMSLYAALGTDGRLVPLRWTIATSSSRSMLSPSSAAEVADILTRPLPDRGPAGIAWKTGTSAGNRDSWAFGFDRQHLVGVWVGRPDGSTRPGAAAADVALPILARVFALLPVAPRVPLAMPRTANLAATPASDPLRLLFPPPGATLSDAGPVTLRAIGGERPLRFLIEGVALESAPSMRSVQWTPPTPGFYRVTVLDRAGYAAETHVRVVAASDSAAANDVPTGLLVGADVETPGLAQPRR